MATAKKMVLYIPVLILIIYVLLVVKVPSWSEFSTISSLEKGHRYDIFLSAKKIILSFRFLISFAVYLFCTFSFGFPVIIPILKNIRNKVAIPTIVLASFIPGYLVHISLNRIVSLLLPHRPARALSLLLMISLAAGVFFFFSKHIKEYFYELKELKKCIVENFVEIILYFSLFFTVLVLLYRMGGHKMIGDGAVSYLTYLRNFSLGQGTTLKLPILFEHYDELLYLYPIFFLFRSSISPLVIPWVITALSKVSAAGIIFLFFRFYNIKSIYAVFGIIFVFFGSTSINPLRYMLLFDSGNPMMNVLHIGRVISCILIPFSVIMTHSVLPINQFFSKKTKSIFSFICLLAIVGLTATSVHNLLYYVLFSLLILLVTFYKSHLRQLLSNTLKYKTLVQLFYIFAIAVPTILSFHEKVRGKILPGVLLFISILLLLVLLSSLFFSNPFKNVSSQNNTKNIISFIFAGCLIGAFLGNLMGKALSEKIDLISLYGTSLLQRPGINTNITSLTSLTPFSDNFGCGPSPYCFSSEYFILFYGLILLALWFIIKSLLEQKDDSNDWNYYITPTLLLTTILFLTALFFVNFVEFSSLTIMTWVWSRFIEVPCYAIIMYFIVIGFRGGRNKKILVSIFLVTWSIIPFFANSRPVQIYFNLIDLLKNLEFVF